MEIAVKNDGDTAVISVAGFVNIQSAPRLLQVIQDNIQNPKSSGIIVNLSEVEFMDSSGVGVLVTGLKAANAKTVRFGLAEMSPRVRSVMEITRLCKLFQIYPNVQTALRDL